MKFAIAVDGDQVASHFGRCECYQIIDVSDDQITNRYRLDSPGHAPGQLPELLNGEDVDYVVAGGMGPMAQQHFTQMGIETILGVSGLLEDAISQIAAAELVGGEDQCVH